MTPGAESVDANVVSPGIEREPQLAQFVEQVAEVLLEAGLAEGGEGSVGGGGGGEE